MKKKNSISLSLNKKSISNLENMNSVKGGLKTIISCAPNGICGASYDNNCGTQDCGTRNCGSRHCGNQTDTCSPSISCKPAGIC